MIRAVSLFAICLGLTLVLATRSLEAMPLGAAKGVGNAAPADLIQKAHGCHHFCARGPAGWHRHGPRCGRWRC